MLYESRESEALLARFAPSELEGHVLRQFCACRDRERTQAILLVDDPHQPSVLLAHHGAHFTMAALEGREDLFASAFKDLSIGDVQQVNGWPDQHLAEDWKQAKRPYLFLDTAPKECHLGALRSGFISLVEDESEAPYAYAYGFLRSTCTPPQPSHSCRLGREDELLELLKIGIHYDPEGHYIRRCLRNGPSFICEYHGEPVSWSATHLTRTMGMIFTPPEHRRHGYAESLGSFQLTHMIERDGRAIAHVVETNEASINLLTKLGGQRLKGQVCWRSLRFPETSPYRDSSN